MKMIIGPCAIEGHAHTLSLAIALKHIQSEVISKGYPDFEIIFKSSYSKANRTKHNSYKGIGLPVGLGILNDVREQTGLRITADVHSPDEASIAGEVLDIIQIPHQMCRNTDLICAAARTGKIISVKKGTFMDPADFQYIVEKIRKAGNNKDVIAVERGNHFGYGDVVVDMRNFNLLRRRDGRIDPKVVTCLDATHPSCGSAAAPALAKAGVAAGADMIFLEVHDEPHKALCDGHCMIDLKHLRHLIFQLLRIHKAATSYEDLN